MILELNFKIVLTGCVLCTENENVTVLPRRRRGRTPFFPVPMIRLSRRLAVHRPAGLHFLLMQPAARPLFSACSREFSLHEKRPGYKTELLARFSASDVVILASVYRPCSDPHPGVAPIPRCAVPPNTAPPCLHGFAVFSAALRSRLDVRLPPRPLGVSSS